MSFTPCAQAQSSAAADVPQPATSDESAVGLSGRALPAILNLNVAQPNRSKVAVAGGLGYGWVGSGGGVNPGHRLFGSLAAAYSPTEAWSLGADLKGRRDSLDGDPSANAYGEPRLAARYTYRVNDRISWGGQLELRLVGAEAPSVDLQATSAALRGLFSWRAPTRTTLAAELGFHLDRSAEAVPDASRVSAADKQSLGASSFNGLPWGVGVSHRLQSTKTELLAELGGEWLIGVNHFLESPIHLGLGARHPLSESFSAVAAIQLGTSARPETLRGADLIPIEPRVAGLATLIWHWDRSTQPKAPPPAPEPKPLTEPEPESAPAVVEPTSAVSGTVVDEGGRPLPDVEVQLSLPNEPPQTQRTDAEGRFEFEAVRLLAGELAVTAEGYDSARVSVPASGATADAPRAAEIVMRPAVPAGQVKGRVLDLKGQPVTATISVTPSEQTIAVQADGSFELELAPGKYTLKFEHPEFGTQQRNIRVVDRGVVILNIALVR